MSRESRAIRSPLVDIDVHAPGQDPDDPATVAALLAGLPEWFGLPDANSAYAAAASTMTTLVARTTEQDVAGVVLLDQHFPASAEIHLMAVARPWHRHGIGRALLTATEDNARRLGARLLTVKTLGPSDPDTHYAATRAFYQATGFIPIEEFDTLWPGTPCLLLAKPLQ